MNNNKDFFTKDEDEKILFARLSDKVGSAVKTCRPTFSYFLDPYTAHKAADFFRSRDIVTFAYGGYEDAERRIVGFFPEYCPVDKEEFPLKAIEVSYNGKFSRPLTHREYLGSVMGLGINREMVGDICLKEEGAVVFVCERVADYILTGLERVSRTAVKTKELKEYTLAPKTKKEKRLTIASLRVDRLLSAAFNISGSKSSEAVKSGKVFINWKEENSPSKLLKEGDIITLRGSGRVKIDSVEGVTKKDRIAINIIIY